MSTSSLEAIVRGGHVGRVETDACKCIGVVVADEHGKIVYANDRVTELFHYEPAELVGRSLAVLMSGDAAQRHDKWFRQWWDHGREHREMSARNPVFGRDRNGSQVATVVTIAPTEWYDKPAALAVILPSAWIGALNIREEVKTTVVLESKP